MRTFRTAVMASSLVVLLTFAGLLLAGRGGKQQLYRALGNLAEVLHLVHENYVDPVDLTTLERGYEGGFLEAIDPDAALLEAEEQPVLDAVPPFGLVLGRRLGCAAARRVLPGSPAGAAGIEEGEILERVGGRKTRTLSLWAVRRVLREAEGAGRSVELLVLDVRAEKRRSVTLAAGSWTVEPFTVESRDGVTVVTLAALAPGTAASLADSLREHLGAPVVLDIRDLVWGTEGEAVAVADLFAADGALGVWKGRRAGEKAFAADAGRIGDPPVTVIDRSTEAAGEILAAALGRAGATLVGQETAGRAPHLGVVQENGLRLVLPIAFWLGPDGEPLDGAGVLPSEEVEPAREGDPMLDRALEIAGEAYGRKAA